VKVADTLVAQDYARQHLSDAVKVQEVLDAARYPQIVEATGELLPRSRCRTGRSLSRGGPEMG
jgi:hypothetical protein